MLTIADFADETEKEEEKNGLMKRPAIGSAIRQ